MKELVVKFHPMHDWPEQKLPVGIIFEELSKIVSEHALSDIQPRESMSASFLCQADYIDKLLRSSGRRGIFIKEKKDSGPPLELLWLGEEQTFQGALDMAEKAATSLGIAQKGPPSATRYALRFRSHDALMKFGRTCCSWSLQAKWCAHWSWHAWRACLLDRAKMVRCRSHLCQQ